MDCTQTCICHLTTHHMCMNIDQKAYLDCVLDILGRSSLNKATGSGDDDGLVAEMHFYINLPKTQKSEHIPPNYPDCDVETVDSCSFEAEPWSGDGAGLGTEMCLLLYPKKPLL